jgi:S1-C subfamily serine protease
VFLQSSKLGIGNNAQALMLRQGVRVSNSQRRTGSHWQSGLLLLGFFIVSAPLVAAQAIPNSAETIAMLKRAVVAVTTEDSQGKPLLQGSGFFIAGDLIVTNSHVIKDAGVIKIEMFGGATRNVENVLALNERDDLALLQLEVPEVNVAVLRLADSEILEGESILVMSNPRSCQWKLTQGQVGPIWQFKGTGKRIQITASILPGSSGAPVVNSEGRVVGIAAMHLDSNDDLNFAVPVESLRALFKPKPASLLLVDVRQTECVALVANDKLESVLNSSLSLAG